MILLFLKQPNSHNLYEKLLESLSTLDIGKLFQVSKYGMYSRFIPVTENRMSSLSWSTLAVLGLMCGMVPCKQDRWKQIGKSTKFYMQCGKYLMNHLQGEIFISGKLVAIFFPCIFARPDGLRMNLLLHKEFTYGRILSRLWCTDFHLRKECPHNNKSFDTLVKYHTDKLMISKIHFLNILHQSWGCFYSDYKPASQWFPSLLLSLM